MDAKRKPLSVMIALQGKDGMKHDDSEGDEGDAPEEEYGKEDGLAASQDLIDALMKRSAKGVNEALARWCETMGYSKAED